MLAANFPQLDRISQNLWPQGNSSLTPTCSCQKHSDLHSTEALQPSALLVQKAQGRASQLYSLSWCNHLARAGSIITALEMPVRVQTAVPEGSLQIWTKDVKGWNCCVQHQKAEQPLRSRACLTLSIRHCVCPVSCAGPGRRDSDSFRLSVPEKALFPHYATPTT